MKVKNHKEIVDQLAAELTRRHFTANNNLFAHKARYPELKEQAVAYYTEAVVSGELLQMLDDMLAEQGKDNETP